LFVSFFWFYVFLALVSWDLNPAEWSVLDRLLWVFCSLLLWIYVMKEFVKSEGGGSDEG